jgi:hypothetical protein
MKKVIITCAFLGLLCTTLGQYNTQLIDSTKIWSILDQPCEGCGGEMYSFYIKVQGDTTISSINYTKIYQALDEFMTEWELYGFIREEQNEFFLRNMAGEEGLAYDFSVNINDTLAINNPFGTFPVQAVITNIDSVYIEPSGEFRKRCHLLAYQYYNYDEYWIEGIGSLAGLTVSGTDLTQLTGGENFNLLCYYEDDVLVYKYSEPVLCYYPIVDILKINQGEVEVTFFPNPVNGISYLNLKNPENKKYRVMINNIYGQIMQEFSITTSEKIEINSADFTGGIYYYSVFRDDQIFCSEKILIK